MKLINLGKGEDIIPLNGLRTLTCGQSKVSVYAQPCETICGQGKVYIAVYGKPCKTILVQEKLAAGSKSRKP